MSRNHLFSIGSPMKMKTTKILKYGKKSRNHLFSIGSPIENALKKRKSENFSRNHLFSIGSPIENALKKRKSENFSRNHLFSIGSPIFIEDYFKIYGELISLEITYFQ